jgi:glycosyltransferase involved in cell wall biosynthesis
MKVLVLTSLFPNNVQPTHAVFVRERMFSFARSTGNEIRVVAPVPYFPAWKMFHDRYLFSQVCHEEEMEGIPVYHPRFFVTPKAGMALYGVWFYLGVLGLVRRIREQFPFDLIDAHYIYPDGAAAVLLGRKLGVPVVVSARGTDLNLFTEFTSIRPWLRFTMQGAVAVVAVSSALRDRALDLGIDGEKVHVVPNGVDARKFYPENRQGALERIGLSREARVVLSVGNLIPSKGFRRLLRAFHRVLREKRHSRLLLVIVGEGPDRNQLERMAGELGVSGQVIFAGRVAHKDLRHWYSAADLFCLASDREGWPNVVQEALSCGTPVVGTSVGGMREIVMDRLTGILASGFDDEELTRCLLEGLDTRWDRAAIARHGGSRSWDQVSRELERLFSMVTQGAA